MEESGEQFVVFCGTIEKLELFAPNLDIKLKVLDDIYLYTVNVYMILQSSYYVKLHSKVFDPVSYHGVR